MPARTLTPDQRSPTSRGYGLGVVEATGLQVEVPEPEASWLTPTKEAHGRFWASEVARLIMVSDLDTVRRYFSELDLRERAEREYRKTPWVENNAGNLVAHPAAGLLKQHEANVARLATELGLSPRARLKLGVTFGQAAESLERAAPEWVDDGSEIEDPRLQVVDVDEVS